jgi:hypothetical protein
MAGTWPESDDPTVFQIGIRETVANANHNPGVIWGRVQQVFTEFCKDSTFKRASALWLTAPVRVNDLQPHEVVVYLVPNSGRSLIARNFPREFNTNPPGPNTIGLTKPGFPILSEVYYDHPALRDEPEFVANAIIHELMHNKLNMDDRMHALAGPAGGFLEDTMRRLSNLEQARRMRLEASGTDIRTMSPALARAQPQFLG